MGQGSHNVREHYVSLINASQNPALPCPANYNRLVLFAPLLSRPFSSLSFREPLIRSPYAMRAPSRQQRPLAASCRTAARARSSLWRRSGDRESTAEVASWWRHIVPSPEDGGVTGDPIRTELYCHMTIFFLCCHLSRFFRVISYTLYAQSKLLGLTWTHL